MSSRHANNSSAFDWVHIDILIRYVGCPKREAMFCDSLFKCNALSMAYEIFDEGS